MLMPCTRKGATCGDRDPILCWCVQVVQVIKLHAVVITTKDPHAVARVHGRTVPVPSCWPRARGNDLSPSFGRSVQGEQLVVVHARNVFAAKDPHNVVGVYSGRMEVSDRGRASDGDLGPALRHRVQAPHLIRFTAAPVHNSPIDPHAIAGVHRTSTGMPRGGCGTADGDLVPSRHAQQTTKK